MPAVLEFFADTAGLAEPLLDLLVVMHERCHGLVVPQCASAGHVVVVRQAAQQNGFDKRRLFADMNMKAPIDALQFRYSSLAVCGP